MARRFSSRLTCREVGFRVKSIPYGRVGLADASHYGAADAEYDTAEASVSVVTGWQVVYERIIYTSDA